MRSIISVSRLTLSVWERSTTENGIPWLLFLSMIPSDSLPFRARARQYSRISSLNSFQALAACSDTSACTQKTTHRLKWKIWRIKTMKSRWWRYHAQFQSMSGFLVILEMDHKQKICVFLRHLDFWFFLRSRGLDNGRRNRFRDDSLWNRSGTRITIE